MNDALPLMRNSERKDFGRCIWRWWQLWHRGYRPSGPPSDALWFGIGVHEALAAWYLPGTQRGPHPAETFLTYCDDEMRFMRTNFSGEHYFEEKYVEARELGTEMLVGYVEYYGEDEHMDVIAPEQTFSVVVPDLKGNPAVDLKGTFDLVFRDLTDGRIKLGEHKTAKIIQTGHLPLDNQAGTYWAIATHTLQEQGLIRKTDTLAGIEYNFLRKALTDKRPVNADGKALNKDGTVSKVQPAPVYYREFVKRTWAERRTQLKRIVDETQHMNAVRSGRLPIIKSPTWSCHWDCPVRDLCELDESGGDTQEMLDLAYAKWDPYAQHRKSAGE